MEQVGQVMGECQYLQMLIVHHWCSLVERVGKLSWPTKWCQTFWRKEPSKTTSQDNYIPNTSQLGVAALNFVLKPAWCYRRLGALPHEPCQLHPGCRRYGRVQRGLNKHIWSNFFCFVFYFDEIWFQSCPDPGIRPPPIQFDNSEFYGFSEFW